MTTPADFTTRTREEIFNIYTAYQSLAKRISDMTDEVTALGGVAGIYGAGGVNWPDQGDGFTLANLTAAYGNIVKLVGAPTTAEKQSIIRTRRD